MALPASGVWEARPTGDPNNGGGFRAAGTGTDYSQQDAPLIAFTDLTVDATTNTNVTSAQVGFTAAHKDNIIRISGGTGFTAGWYWITAVTGGVATLDRSPGAVGIAGGTGRIGGALDAFATLALAMVASNKAFVRAGAGYTTTATSTFAQNVTPDATHPPSRLIGYTTTRGDGGRATLTLATTTGLSGLKFTGGGWCLDNLAVDCAGLGTSNGIELTSAYYGIRNCLARNFSNVGLYANGAGYVIFYHCEATGGTAAAIGGAYATGTSNRVVHSYIHDNACRGIWLTWGNAAVGNLIANNTGAASDGINVYYGTLVVNNVIYKSGRHGIFYLLGSNFGGQLWINNILAENGGYGIMGGNAAGLAADLQYDGNAFYANTSGARANMDDVGAVNAVNGVVPYVNAIDILLTADPFVNKAANDFRLNNNPGGGAAARGHGLPASWPGNSLTVGSPDMGAAQHQDTGGAITNLFWIES